MRFVSTKAVPVPSDDRRYVVLDEEGNPSVTTGWEASARESLTHWAAIVLPDDHPRATAPAALPDGGRGLPKEEYAAAVRAVAAEIQAEAGEVPDPVSDDDVERLRRAGFSVLSAAAHCVSEIRVRKFDRGPYDRQEERVAEYLRRLLPEIGVGFDPVGFLLASHATLVVERRAARAASED